MTDPPTTNKKYLSYSAILAISANTMNGPAFTTLPDVAADAGLCLYVTLIALSVAAFVCRRMVYAVWSSLNNEESAVMDVEQQEKEDYSSIKKVDSGLIQRLAISSSNKEEEVAEVGEIDEIIPEATIGGKEE